MSKKKLLFIYNPKAGKERIRYHLSDILNTFAEEDYEITAYPTRKKGDATARALSLEDDYELLVVSGGDGTLDEVVTGLKVAGKDIPIGYIPAGSTNDFGRSLGLPKSMKGAAEIAVRGADYRCDIGKFNNDYFVYVAAFGLFTDVTYMTPQKKKNVLGYGAYVLEGVKRLSDVRTFHAKIEYEGGCLEGDYLAGLISNSNSVGGFYGITGPHVSLNDGLFEILLIKMPPTLLELNEILIAVFDRRYESEYVISLCAPSVCVMSDEAIPWTLDGEYGGDTTCATITVLNEAINVKTKKSTGSSHRKNVRMKRL